jgi:hypothetical protein
MGFSGFEGRHYSVFESLTDDMGEAASLQTLITALAFKYILNGEVTHHDIPDDPFIESERRQIFFGAAIGIPTFYVRRDTKNRFLTKILKQVKRTRLSHRYPGYHRIYNLEYRKALVDVIKREAADLIELMCLQETVRDLEQRIENLDTDAAAGRLTKGILDEANVSTPMKLSAHEFNGAAERYYRHALKRRHMQEAFKLLEEDFKKIDSCVRCGGGFYQEAHMTILDGSGPSEFFSAVKENLVEERVPAALLRKLIHLTLLTIHNDIQQCETNPKILSCHEICPPPVC